MKIGIIIILVVAAMLAGVGASFVMVKSMAKPGHDAPKKEPPKPTKMIVLDERTINLADTAAQHYARLTIAVEVVGEGEEVVKKFDEDKPIVLDCLIDIVGKQVFKDLLTAKGKEALKKELAKAFAEKLKEKKWEVKEVFFTDFVME